MLVIQHNCYKHAVPTLCQRKNRKKNLTNHQKLGESQVSHFRKLSSPKPPTTRY